MRKLTCLILLLAPFQNLIAEDKPMPCTDAAFAHFDFWLGDWDVSDGDGKNVGENSIYKVAGGCAISENWKSANNNTGVSYNFYDNRNKRWHQTWVDDAAGILFLNGGLEHSSMVLSGTRPGKDGSIITHQISWTPLEDGRVKQHWQASKNGGEKWNDVFIGFYVKKTPIDGKGFPSSQNQD